MQQASGESRQRQAASHSVTDVAVLIVGGGPVGLTASLLLSRAGVRSLLVERHPSTAGHPKARAINARSMEIYRHCGIEAEIRAAGLAPEHAGLVVWTRTLSGEEIERRVPWRSSARSLAVSPVRNCLCAQDDLEPVLRRAAERQGGELRFATELTDCEEDREGVTAVVMDHRSGRKSRVRAQYVIAADGAQSGVRHRLGVRMIGRDRVYESVNVLLKADLRPWTAHRPPALYFVEHPKLKATFLTINAADRWGFLVNSLAAYGYEASAFTPRLAAELVRMAAGVPDLEVEILSIARWTASAHVAERYRHGRIFLAGDAAHEMPPTGGFGLNTGVQDAHNLAWKLALVLNGAADAALLDTYHDERQPAGRAITEQSLDNSLSMGRLGASATATARPEYLNEQGMIFGIQYASTAVLPDGTPAPVVANPVTDYVASARPGGRAPHVALSRNGQAISTIDLFGAGFVLLTGRGGGAWRRAAEGLGRPPLAVFGVGEGQLEDKGDRWSSAYGVGADGAVLVRPDGHVAWRSPAMVADPPGTLAAALARILSRHGADRVPADPG
jgi:2-polyprenyl-6-methoxyphenol hydroxylase-like FAD-dependent oxidoreductase